MIYKTRSIKEVIAKIGRDFNLTGTSWILNSYEWIGEALQEIGTHSGLERKSIILESHNHRCPLPCDHESTIDIEYRGRRLSKGHTQKFSEFTPIRSENIFGAVLSNVDTYDGCINKGVAPDNTIPYIVQNNLQQPPIEYGERDYYQDNPDYIITSFEEDCFTLHYQAYLLDSEGLPIIPDSPEFREALEFYVLYKYLSRGNKHVVWDMKSAYDMWIKYKGKAQNRAKYPDIQSMESFKNMWVRIIKIPREADTFFKGSEDQEYIYNI